MNPSLRRAIRLLNLVPYLQRHHGISVDEVARDFGVTPRQITEDLTQLMMTGPGELAGELIDIDQFALEDDAKIYIRDADFMTRPLRVTRTEAASLVAALEHLREFATDPATVDSAIAKLLSTAESGISAGAVTVHADETEPYAAVILKALADGRQLELSYAGADDSISQRIVDPVRVFEHEGHRYFASWCHSADGPRTFRFDRVVAARQLPTPVEDHPETEWPETFSFDSLPVVATLELAPAASWMVDYHAFSEQERHEDGTRIVTVRASDSQWVVRFVRNHSDVVTLIAPADLRRVLGQSASDALAAYTRTQL